jgi:hypothetical protein
MHAEVNTINKYIALYRKKGYKDADIRRKLGKQCLIVVRINNNKNSSIPFTNSAPCNQCIEYLKQYNIQKIIYSIDDGSLHFERVKDLEGEHISRGQRAIIRKSNGIVDS